FSLILSHTRSVASTNLKLYDFTDANGSGSGGICVDDAEPGVCLKECVHHDAVAELEDLQGEDGAREEHQREKDERKLDDVIGVRGVHVVLLGEGRAAKNGIKLLLAKNVEGMMVKKNYFKIKNI
ncbi:hypothetical protein V8G54_011038, partial [Vigna mungo]